MEEKRVAIVGAGLSGLIACKYVKEKGFLPIVFEMKDNIGGVWLRTLESTLLQTHRFAFHFSDFPWPSSITKHFPTHAEVLEYIQSYAKHFKLHDYIQFNSKVVGMDFLKNSDSNREDGILSSMSADPWYGEAFGSGGTWHVTVYNAQEECTKVHTVDFVIICTGRYGDIPKMPSFERGKGPDVFNGNVMHAVDLYTMDHEKAHELIKGKKVVVVGFQKSAYDIAEKCARTNGMELPCTIICRAPSWHFPHNFRVFTALGFLYSTRFAELLQHKPGESFLLGLLATLLSPLRWGVTKFVETWMQWLLPLKKYDILPEGSFFDELASCHIFFVSENFYSHVEERRIIIKKSAAWSFCEEGLMLENESEPLQADLVILATGYRANQKLNDIFKSSAYQNLLIGMESGIAPLYRECIHPRIPQAAIIGYTESISNLFTSEMEVRWLACFLAGGFRLPSTTKMEEDMKKWDDYKRKHLGYKYQKSSIATIHIWYNDQLCRDMGCNPKRKNNWFSELFLPYGPEDYSNLKI